jgi:hypothetical protein
LTVSIKTQAAPAAPQPRLCGRARTAGSAYAMTSVPIVEREFDAPIDAFLICPPKPIPDYQAWGISPSGMTVIEDLGGRTDEQGQPLMHLVDWIGAGTGPHSVGAWNWSDHFEEGKKMGFSSKLPMSRALLAPLTPGLSGRYLIHPHGHVLNPLPLWRDRQKVWCPAHHEYHLAGEHPDWICQSLLWECVYGGKPLGAGEPPSGSLKRPPSAVARAVRRFCPGYLPEAEAAFFYDAHCPPDDYTPEWQPAIVAWLPITQIDVVADTVGGRHESTLARLAASGCRLPYEVKSESITTR